MRMILSNPLDLRQQVKLTVAIPEAGSGSWPAEIASLFESFEHFVAAGGLVPVIDLDLRWPGLAGTMEQEPGSLSCAWPGFPYGANGLAVLLRMIAHLQHGKDMIASVSLSGTPVVGEQPCVLGNLETAINTLPARLPAVPFQLKLTPYGSWINIECDLLPPFSNEISAALDSAIRSWCKVANAGGFQVVSEAEGAGRVDQFGVGIDGPTIADNFVQWQCLMTGVPPGSLVCLINIFARFAKSVFPISAVFIG